MAEAALEPCELHYHNDLSVPSSPSTVRSECDITPLTPPHTPRAATRSNTCPFSVVVAIDFGTTSSGYAFSFTDSEAIHIMKRWEGGDPGVAHHKSPTCLLLTPDLRFHSFGFSARDFYHDMDPEEARLWLYLDKFKMKIHSTSDVSMETELEAVNGRKVRAIEVFAHALRFFREHALKEVKEQSSTVLEAEQIRWVITVPAVWRQPAKQFMREAAYLAGLMSPHCPEQLLIALEPEAASIYCRKLRLHQVIDLSMQPISNGLGTDSSRPLDSSFRQARQQLRRSRHSRTFAVESGSGELWSELHTGQCPRYTQVSVHATHRSVSPLHTGQCPRHTQRSVSTPHTQVNVHATHRSVSTLHKVSVLATHRSVSTLHKVSVQATQGQCPCYIQVSVPATHMSVSPLHTGQCPRYTQVSVPATRRSVSPLHAGQCPRYTQVSVHATHRSVSTPHTGQCPRHTQVSVHATHRSVSPLHAGQCPRYTQVSVPATRRSVSTPHTGQCPRHTQVSVHATHRSVSTPHTGQCPRHTQVSVHATHRSVSPLHTGRCPRYTQISVPATHRSVSTLHTGQCPRYTQVSVHATHRSVSTLHTGRCPRYTQISVPATHRSVSTLHTGQCPRYTQVSVHATHRSVSTPHTGDRYVVADCGGGTVDLTVHQIEQPQNTLKELYKASGGPHGAVGVDLAFESMLCEIFGEDFIQSFKAKRPAAWVDLSIAFEARKRTAAPGRANALNISLPFSFIDFYKRHRGHSVEAALRRSSMNIVKWSSQGMLRLTQEAMHELFQPTIQNIVRHIEELLRRPEVQGVHFLFLVGGFAESPMLQKAIQRSVGRCCRVIIPHDVGLTILKGAVLFGLDPSVIRVRRCPLTYGVGVLNRFVEGRHPRDKLLLKDGRQWCTDILDRFVCVDQSVALGEVVRRSYTPARVGQKKIIINIYCSCCDDAVYVTDPGVSKCGTITLELPANSALPCPRTAGLPPATPPQRREIRATMQFGDTEIKVTAVDVLTNLSVRASVDFLSN
uniref:Heat shock 70 kDa protein 12B n=1 Tax=Knipowitschia caucasica TaxID=637954 RepID=A0AAV2KPC4_KNICA